MPVDARARALQALTALAALAGIVVLPPLMGIVLVPLLAPLAVWFRGIAQGPGERAVEGALVGLLVADLVLVARAVGLAPEGLVLLVPLAVPWFALLYDRYLDRIARESEPGITA